MQRSNIIIAFLISLSSWSSAQSLQELRPPAGVLGNSSTPGRDAFEQGLLVLADLQIQLEPVLNRQINLNSSEDEIATARTLIQTYLDQATDTGLIAALLVNTTREKPIPQDSLITLLQEQATYIFNLSAILGDETETFYRSIILDVRFEDLDAELQAAMMGRYVQQLLLRTELTEAETSVLAVVDTVPFIEALAEITGTSLGVENPRELDWDELVGVTIDIHYYNERMRLVERTAEVLAYRKDLGVTLPPTESNSLNIRVKLSRIEYVRLPE